MVMKNLTKRKRTKYYRELPKWQYLASDNRKVVDEITKFTKMSVDSMERRFNFLKRYCKDDKVLLSKCQKLINSKRLPPQ